MIKYVGGKYYLSKWIINNFPNDYQKMCYVEVFGGMAWVLLRKERSKIEIYNDIDGDVVNMFLQIRDNPKEILRKVYYTPYSREYFNIAKKKYKERSFKDDVERAIVYMTLLRMSFSGSLSHPSFSYSRKVNVNMNNIYKRIKRYIGRLREVCIENLDYRDIIERYDSPNTLFYLDPPYYKTEKYYRGGFNKNDHIDLANILKSIKGKFILSYYPCEITDIYYKDYNQIEKNTAKHGCGITRVYKETNKPIATELLITNYDQVTGERNVSVNNADYNLFNIYNEDNERSIVSVAI